MKKLPGEKVIPCSFRFTDTVLKELDVLCDTYSRNRTQIIEMLITGEYYKSTEIGKKKLQKIVSDMNNLSKSFEEIASK